MRIILYILLSVVLFVSCKCDKKSTNSKTQIENKKPKVTLQVFNAGDILVNKLELFSEKGDLYQGESKSFVDPTYIITHPKGRIIWDTGLPENLVGLSEPTTVFNGAFTISREDSLKNQLKIFGLTPEDFDYVALSHHHFDHIGTVNYFNNDTLLIQENEYDLITSDSTQKNDPNTYQLFKGFTKVKKLSGEFDIFSDGSVVIKPMPGHTIGHQVLYLDLGLERPILLTGDLYHFEENREGGIVPQFNYDIAQTKQSMEQFEGFVKEKNVDVFIQHSPKDLERLKTLLKNINR